MNVRKRSSVNRENCLLNNETTQKMTNPLNHCVEVMKMSHSLVKKKKKKLSNKRPVIHSN